MGREVGLNSESELMRIVLLGAPGSGKGTQAKMLMAEHNVPHISTGDMLREAVSTGTEFGQKAGTIMDAGDLVSDKIMLGIIRERLAQADAGNGFILDGFPRTTQQADDLDNLLNPLSAPLDAAILMDVDFEILMKRLTGRRTCSLTGKLLNIFFSTPQEIEECTAAGGELIQREDDNEEIIGNRLDVYRHQTEPLIDFYRKSNRLKTVDAEGSVDEVFERLKSAIA